MNSWTCFSKGFLEHFQSKTRIYVYAVHPKNKNIHEFVEMFNRIKPKVVAIQMGQKVLLPDPKEDIPLPNFSSGPEIMVADNFNSAFSKSTQDRTFLRDPYTEALLDYSSSHGSIVKFCDIPFLEHSKPSDRIYHELVETAKKRFRVQPPKYYSSWIGHLIYRLCMKYTFKARDIKQCILDDTASAADYLHYYNIYKSFHPPSYHKYFEIPTAVISEKLRTIVKALHTTQPANPSTVLLVVGKPYVFPIIYYWQNFVQNEKFAITNTRFHKSLAQLHLEDSMQVQTIPETVSNSVDEDVIEAVILQASTPLVRFTRPVKALDVVLDVPKLPVQKQRNKEGLLPPSKDPKRSAFGYRYLD